MQAPARPAVPKLSLPDLPEYKPFGERVESLLALDCYRFTRILETAQYAALYTCLCLPVGLLIDWLCARFYPEADAGNRYDGRKRWLAILVAVMQVVLSAVSIIYIRKIADLVPFFFNLCPSRYVAHYHVEEVFGEAAIALVFVGVQVTLVKRLETIRNSFLGSEEK